MGTLVIRLVPKDVARDLVVRGHYSHKWLASFGIHNFGIFREGAETDGDCLGVASFGYMKTPKAHVIESSVLGGWMIELNRMWISDELGHNAETILLGASLKLLRSLDPTIVAVQSFAADGPGAGPFTRQPISAISATTGRRFCKIGAPVKSPTSRSSRAPPAPVASCEQTPPCCRAIWISSAPRRTATSTSCTPRPSSWATGKSSRTRPTRRARNRPSGTSTPSA